MAYASTPSLCRRKMHNKKVAKRTVGHKKLRNFSSERPILFSDDDARLLSPYVLVRIMEGVELRLCVLFNPFHALYYSLRFALSKPFSYVCVIRFPLQGLDLFVTKPLHSLVISITMNRLLLLLLLRPPPC